VLAAGAGRRIGGETTELPKTLLGGDGDRTILDVALAISASSGPRERRRLAIAARQHADREAIPARKLRLQQLWPARLEQLLLDRRGIAREWILRSPRAPRIIALLPSPGCGTAARPSFCNSDGARAPSDRQFARSRRHAYAPDAMGRSEWRFCWSSVATVSWNGDETVATNDRRERRKRGAVHQAWAMVECRRPPGGAGGALTAAIVGAEAVPPVMTSGVSRLARSESSSSPRPRCAPLRVAHGGGSVLLVPEGAVPARARPRTVRLRRSGGGRHTTRAARVKLTVATLAPDEYPPEGRRFFQQGV
jgi:hypothetical protein